jgi:hypothetical protein
MIFFVGTIHGKNKAVQPKDQVEGMGTKEATKVIKITKNNKDISVLTSTMQRGTTHPPGSGEEQE